MEPAALQAQLRTDLTAALRARDRVATSTLRTLLAAIANAEAPDMSVAPTPSFGALVEHDRLRLTPAAVRTVLEHEVVKRLDAAGEFASLGLDDEVVRLEAEVAIVRRYLDGRWP